jgi:hypothetical protein
VGISLECQLISEIVPFSLYRDHLPGGKNRWGSKSIFKKMPGGCLGLTVETWRDGQSFPTWFGFLMSG